MNEEQVKTPKDKTKPGVYIRTFGCQMNEYDSRKLAKLLEQNYSEVKTPQEAQLLLVNTCSVRDKPEQKLYSLLGELRELKKTNPDALIGVGGCVAQQEGQNIIKRSKDVDFVFGTHNLSLVPSLIQLRRDGSPPQVAVDYRDEWEDLPLGLSGDNKIVAYVAISRGCNKNCTFCIVPRTRGPEVSRKLEEIEREVKIAVHRGAREVLLLGQTVNSYGRDFTPRSSFAELLERLSGIENLWRIRFTSPHPQEVREDFVDLVARNPKICRHIHMPLQSGSDRILKAMNRNYRRKRYLEIIESLQARVPEISITTDVIVGFPGETEEDFQQTMEILERVQFDNSYSFVYSPRPGTKAASIPDLMSFEEKLERLQVFQKRQIEITESRLKAWEGKKCEILLDGVCEFDPSCMRGRNSQNIVVNLVRPYEGLETGMCVPAVVTAAARFTLKAELVL